MTGAGGAWSAPGWRTARSAGSDPWTAEFTSLLGATGTSGLQLGAAGELGIGGLEWMGARVYDPASRSFLSTDPLEPVAGAGWSGPGGGSSPLSSGHSAKFHPGTPMYKGTVAPQTGLDGHVYHGGTQQIHIPESWKHGEIDDQWALQ